MNRFENMKLGTKLIGSYLLIALIAAFIGLFGNFKMHKIDDMDTFLYEKCTVPLAQLIEITGGFERCAANIGFIALEKRNDPAHFKSIEDNSKQVEKNLLDYKKTLIDAEDEKNYNEMLVTWANYEKYLKEQLTLAQAGKFEDMNAIRLGAGQKLRDDTRTLINKITDLNVRAAKDTSDKNTAFANKASLTVNIVIASGVLLAVAIGLLITRSLTRQLGGEPKYVGDIVTEVSQGNLAVEVQTKTGDTSSMLFSVKEMVQTLREITGQTVEAANQVSLAADQISEANQSFSQKITEQAASVEETTAAMEEMGASTRSSAENAREANNLARSSKTVAEAGTVVMTDTIAAMNEINKSSAKIANISNVIEEIAFQTNLLALNAAVEAARAGEHGKGFAVVAAEIRSLAGRTTQSAKEITTLIEDSGEKTGRGVQLAQELDHKLNEIVSGIKKVTDLMDEVAAASQEQSAGISQVNTAMSQVDQTTQQNASLVEETSASAEELAVQARALLDVVSFFRVEDTSRRPAKPARFRQESIGARALSSKAGFKSQPAARPPALTARFQASSGEESDFSEF